MHKMKPSVFQSTLGMGFPCFKMDPKQVNTSKQSLGAEEKALVIRVRQNASLKLRVKFIITSRHYRVWACYMSKIA